MPGRFLVEDTFFMKTREVFVAHGQLLDGNRVLILAFANRDEARPSSGALNRCSTSRHTYSTRTTRRVLTRRRVEGPCLSEHRGRPGYSATRITIERYR